MLLRLVFLPAVFVRTVEAFSTLSAFRHLSGSLIAIAFEVKGRALLCVCLKAEGIGESYVFLLFRLVDDVGILGLGLDLACFKLLP